MHFIPKPVVLRNQDATRENVLRELAHVANETKPDDALLIFFAGHGVASGDGYYLLPQDVAIQGDAVALAYPMPTSNANCGIWWPARPPQS
jgi:hypothetical protein